MSSFFAVFALLTSVYFFHTVVFYYQTAQMCQLINSLNITLRRSQLVTWVGYVYLSEVAQNPLPIRLNLIHLVESSRISRYEQGLTSTSFIARHHAASFAKAVFSDFISYPGQYRHVYKNHHFANFANTIHHTHNVNSPTNIL